VAQQPALRCWAVRPVPDQYVLVTDKQMDRYGIVEFNVPLDTL